MQTQENRNVPFLTATAAIALLVALVASPAFARGTGGGGVGAGASMGTSMGSQSGSHISAQGSANSNGVNALDRDTGTARAEDRESANDLKHGHKHANESAHSTTDVDTHSR